MKLYEIDEAVRDLEEGIDIDLESDEPICDVETVEARLHTLRIGWRQVMEWITKVILNTRAEEEAFKTEVERLKEHRKTLNCKKGLLMQVLQRAYPRTARVGVAVLTYRKFTRVEVTDEAAAVEWLREHHYTTCYREPTVRRSEVRKLLEAGKKIPGCRIVEEQTAYLR